ncbi:YcxB family protein [Yinghuangia seranimata]|uniref:YcxB family protein n=1 Tax=Yinghuangia seranimata TaxID=408067 RepID=UPI00248A9C17|nr:YcxB family protein [Yinghuangia seranimata]MDI2132663.1 YcxB family protein [Yinghuangia seranimata]
MHITASYIPTERDVADGVVAFRKGLFRGLLGAGVFLVGAGLVVLVIEALGTGLEFWPFVFLGFGAAMLALRFWAPLQAARQNRHMHSDVCEVTLTDNAYRSAIGAHRAEIPWSNFRKLRSVDDQWIFEFSQAQAIMVPHRVFSSAENAEIGDFLRERGLSRR